MERQYLLVTYRKRQYEVVVEYSSHHAEINTSTDFGVWHQEFEELDDYEIVNIFYYETGATRNGLISNKRFRGAVLKELLTYV